MVFADKGDFLCLVPVVLVGFLRGRVVIVAIV